MDSGLDLTIINLHTWKTLGKPTLLRSNEMAKPVSRKKIKFEGELITNVTFQGRMLKRKTLILKNTENLFDTDWMEKFNLWDMSINSFCQKLEHLTTDAKNSIKDLKETSPEFFSGFMLWEPYLSHHNGLFSPLLVLRDFTSIEADQYRCYPNSTRLLTFPM